MLSGVLSLILVAEALAVALLAGLWLLLRGRSRPRVVSDSPDVLHRGGRVRPRIVIDGSNVMHWRGDRPEIDSVRDVVQRVAALDYEPGVVFDANAGYRLSGSYLNERALAERLGLPADQVLVVNKGVPADLDLLRAARAFDARIVTNDRFRDWAEQFPEIATPGHLIRGGYRDGALWLDLVRSA